MSNLSFVLRILIISTDFQSIRVISERMNGGGNREEGNGKLEIQEEAPSTNNKKKSTAVLMWGYLPGISQQRSPLFSPSAVEFPYAGDSWKDVCGGGCGFAMAISGNSSLSLYIG